MMVSESMSFIPVDPVLLHFGRSLPLAQGY